MGYWSLITPEATTNLVTNPSVELATTGYTAVGGSVARSATYQRRGVYSLAVTPTAGTGDGVYYGTVTLTDATAYTLGVDFRGVAGVAYKIYFADTSANLQGTATSFTATGAWERQSATYTASGTAARRLYVIKDNSASTGVFYIDGIQVEAKAYATTYADGEQDGCGWNGTAHVSTSYRLASSRAGGREINLDSYGAYILSADGSGVPPSRHLVQELAIQPGALFTGRKVLARTLVLLADLIGSSRANLHSLRKTLIDAIKPDIVAAEQPVIFRYSGASTTVPALDLYAYYDSGLSGPTPVGFTEEISVRFIAYDPYWYDDGQAGAALTGTQTLANPNYVVAKIAGTWQKMGTGMNGRVYCWAQGPDGAIYAGGAFTTAGGTTVNHVAKWDGSAWSAMGGTPGVDDDVRAMVFDAAGNLYVGGKFVNAGGGAAKRIAKWDGSNWAAVGGGIDDGIVYALAVGLTGILWAAGTFTLIGGASAVSLGSWDGSAWTNYTGLGGASKAVYALAIDPRNGDVYIGGAFNGMAAKVLTTSTYTSLNGTSVDNWVYTLAFDKSGLLYAGGSFAAIGGITVNRIATWNGQQWEALSTGLTQYPATVAGVVDIVIAPPLVYVAGYFKGAGDADLPDGAAIWTGSTWAPIDIDLTPGSATELDAMLLTPGGDFYLAGNFTASAVTGYTQTVTNAGTAEAYPVLTVKRSGGTTAVLAWLKNETAGDTVWFEYSLLDGETITVDFRPGRRRVTSSYFGEVWQALLRNSDFGNFRLLPGANLLTLVVSQTGSPTVTALLTWRNTYWSADGAA